MTKKDKDFDNAVIHVRHSQDKPYTVSKNLVKDMNLSPACKAYLLMLQANCVDSIPSCVPEEYFETFGISVSSLWKEAIEKRYVIADGDDHFYLDNVEF